MIINERQLRITKAQAARFEQALAERSALASQLESLRAEIAEYETLRQVQVSERVLLNGR